MRAVGLFRVSTETQANEGASLDAQQRRYREWCVQNGAESLGEFRGQESAAKAGTEREVLQQVLRAVRELGPDVLFVIEQSRLTRGDELEVALLVRELRERGIKVAVGGAIRDLASIDDTLMFGVQSLMDRAEHARFRERTARGRREKALQGKRTGKAPFGYRNPPKGDARRGILQIEESEASTVRLIFEQVAAGDSIRTIAERLNALGVPAPKGGRWGKTTVRSVTRNATYAGTTVTSAWRSRDGALRYDPSHPSAVVVPDTHEPVISPALFQQARAAIHGNSTGLPCLLTGLLHVNGQRAHVDRSGPHSYYVPADRSHGPWVQVETVNAAAWEGFSSLFYEPDALLALLRGVGEASAPVETAEAELEALERQEAKLRARLERLVQMRADGEIGRAEFADGSASTKRSLQEAERAAQAIKRRTAAATDGELERAVLATRALIGARTLGMAQKRRVLKSMVHSVYVQVEPGKQARTPGGGYGSSPRWRVADLWFRLYGCHPEATTVAGSDRALVAVAPRNGGRPEPVEEWAQAGA